MGGLEKNLRLRNDIPLPPSATSLKPDEVLVKTLATSLNPVDYTIAELPVLGRLIIKRPSSPGLDFSGRVVALGPDSGKCRHHLEPGMMVIGRLGMPTQYGALGKYLTCPREGAVTAPSGMSAEDAAAMGTAGLTAMQSLQPCVREGSNVFINGGSGGVGLFGIQIAKALGCSVTVTCSSANAELCRSLGADQVIDYRTTDVVQELKKSQLKYYLSIDNVATKDLYWAMEISLADVLDVLLRLFTSSFLAGPRRKLTYLGCTVNPRQLTQIAEWVKEGRVRVVKDEVFAYNDAPRAFAKLKTSRARGKSVIMAEAE